jgi:hypothetical protein
MWERACGSGPVGAGLPANEFCQAEIRSSERLRAAPGSPRPVLRLTRIPPGCPRIAKCLRSFCSLGAGLLCR